MNIKNIIFDLGGVIMTIDQPAAVERFKALGLDDAQQRLDPYTQSGIFGQLEEGKITADEFVERLSQLTGRQLTWQQCKHAWRGYTREVPAENIRALDTLRARGYRLILLSNTNPFMMDWAMNEDFTGDGRHIQQLFDAMYLSYRMRMMKPAERMFRRIIAEERIKPYETLFVDDAPRNVMVASQTGLRTFCPANGEPWAERLFGLLDAE